MRILRIVSGVLLAMSIGVSQAAETKNNPAFEKLKALEGVWEGKGPDGDVKVTYRVVSAGSALSETIENPGRPPMLSVYYLDGGRLTMTHFCSLGNQPRMRAEASSADPKKLEFSMFDATNLPSASAPHMHKLLLTFDDPTHLTEEWMLTDKGKEQPVVLRLARGK